MNYKLIVATFAAWVHDKMSCNGYTSILYSILKIKYKKKKKIRISTLKIKREDDRHMNIEGSNYLLDKCLDEN